VGIFRVAIRVGNPGGGDPVLIPEALVDTGASHSMLPESLLASLHLEPRDRITVTLADGARKEMGYGMARFFILDRDWDCPVLFGPENKYLVGATTLETFDLMVDPVDRRLVRRTHEARPL
jgi:predicted aspartyl protease